MKPTRSYVSSNKNMNVLPTKENFLSGKLDCFLDGGFSIFDYQLKNALLFSQGDWSLIRRDLLLVHVPESSIRALEDGPCAELIRAFRVRRELIHYKKVCLHLLHEAQAIERRLKQAKTFFLWQDGDDVQLYATALMHAMVSLAKVEIMQQGAMNDLEDVKTAMERHAGGETDKTEAEAEAEAEAQSESKSESAHESKSCRLVDRKLLFALAQGTWVYHIGVTRALQDARDVIKAICLSPRHPDGEANGERPQILHDLPTSMTVERAVHKAEREDACKISKRNKNSLGVTKEHKDSQDAQQEYAGINTSTVNVNNRGVAKINRAMQRILDAVRRELKWPKELVDFLALSIVARGGFKALTMVEELSIYGMHLTQLLQRIKTVLERYKDAQKKVFEEFQQGGYQRDFAIRDITSACNLRRKTINMMHGILDVCRENTKWVLLISSLASESGCSAAEISRLFVAGDDRIANSSFLPTGFQLTNFVIHSRTILEQILMPTMLCAVEKEQWPPALDSRRTSVRAFDKTFIRKGDICKERFLRCCTCEGYFYPMWIRGQTCAVCEAIKRNQSDGKQCLFIYCKGGPWAYCPHDRRCFVCDAPHSCERCRMFTGNGDLATAMVETIRPKMLLLDFDRTLCSTRTGGSPLPDPACKRHSTVGYSHSIDAELKQAVLMQRTHGESYIITRNSHKTEIEAFLDMQNLQELAKHVHVVPKTITKGEYIRDTFSSSHGETSLFIDDSITELTADAWVRTAPNMHRLLFRRY